MKRPEWIWKVCVVPSKSLRLGIRLDGLLLRISSPWTSDAFNIFIALKDIKGDSVGENQKWRKCGTETSDR